MKKEIQKKQRKSKKLNIHTLKNTIDNRDTSLVWSVVGSIFFLLLISLGIKETMPENTLTDVYFEVSHREDVRAKSWYVFDGNKILSEYNSEIPYSLASLVKPFTLSVVLPLIDENTIISISENALAQEGNSYLQQGEKYTKEELAMLSMHHSSNDAIFELYEQIHPEVFKKEYENKALELNLSSLYTQTPTGLDRDDRAQAFGSAKEIDTIIRYFTQTYPEIANVSSHEHLMVNNRIFTNTNPIVEDFNNLVFSKTGYTDESGGNLALLFENGASIIILGSTFTDRFSDAWLLYTKYLQ